MADSRDIVVSVNVIRDPRGAVIQTQLIKNEPPYVKAGIVTTIVGKDGSLIYTGSGVPSNELGVFADLYIDNVAPNNFYQKDANDVWILKGNLQGGKGDDGREILIQNNGTYIQWQYDGDVSWTNIVALSDLKGADGIDGTNGTNGKNIELQKGTTHIQWRLVGDLTWIDLIAIADLKGEDGYTPVKGVDYFDGRGIASFDLINTVGKTKTYRLLYTDATYVDINIIDGNDGNDGATPHIGLNGNWYIGTTDTGVKAAGADGTNGTDGVGISNIAKTGTVDNVDEYTITFTNTSTFIFYVTNGLNGTNGTNGTNGSDGRGIVSIIKTSTVGLVDTYTITYTDATTSTFDVTNGTNGEMNVIEEVKVNSVPLTVTNKSVNVIVPTQPSDIGAEPANDNIQEHIGDETKHIDTTTAEFSGAIDETNDKFTIYDFSLLKWLRFSFTNLKSYLKTYFDNIYQATLGYTPENVANKENSTIDTSTTKYPTVNLLKSGLDAKQAINLKFTDTSASSWVTDTTYTNYGYKCELTLSGVTATDVAEVAYAHAEAVSGNYSPVCLTATDKVTIYSKVNTTITIPTILINKQS